MALVGCLLLLWYLGLAAVSYWALSILRHSAPDPVATLVLIVVIALVTGVLSYRFGTRQLLASLEAVELPRSHAPGFHRRLDALESRMAVDSPTVLIARLPMPNAFALGSARNGVIVLDRSLFRLLSLDELEALAAHELAHLERHDAFVQTLAYSGFRTVAGLVFLVLAPLLMPIAGAARAVAWMRGNPASWSRTVFGRLLALIEGGVMVAFLLVTLVVRAHSRRREYAADDRAAAVSEKPIALARALRTIDRAAEPSRGLLATLYVQTDDEDSLSRLLATHPATDERIERLVERTRDSSGRTHRPMR
ncbi:M48 family metalloprotease [Natrinema sp. 1APR25-10V2]|uniref:M48 family metallopeptidase n=1 Tax=Natrinema sp. 1APR25-10V2 TaxID=2951081 RepID=UPI0028746335|nr:M48 family metalloprotease [Natrinema sp. 1APR25-10V2]MDS0477866.1 M48 family metalloprotease [Natrinema sp. 1APR25-10V2]